MHTIALYTASEDESFCKAWNKVIINAIKKRANKSKNKASPLSLK